MTFQAADNFGVATLLSQDGDALHLLGEAQAGVLQRALYLRATCMASNSIALAVLQRRLIILDD